VEPKFPLGKAGLFKKRKKGKEKENWEGGKE
jgi:hypothetical protein